MIGVHRTRLWVAKMPAADQPIAHTVNQKSLDAMRFVLAEDTSNITETFEGGRSNFIQSLNFTP